jgi:hypothetical protein
MKDSYSKTCLTLIVLLLALIALRPIFSPTVADAQSYFSGLQISSESNGKFLLFDGNSGHIWYYDVFREVVTDYGRIETPGKLLIKESKGKR